MHSELDLLKHNVDFVKITSWNYSFCFDRVFVAEVGSQQNY